MIEIFFYTEKTKENSDTDCEFNLKEKLEFPWGDSLFGFVFIFLIYHWEYVNSDW